MERKKNRWAVFLVISAMLMIAAAGCGQPIREDSEEEAENMELETTTSEGIDESQQTFFEQNGIRLFHDPQLILDVQPFSETIAAEEEGEPGVVAHPEIIHFDLSMEQAHVYISEIKAYEAAADYAAESFSQLRTLISNLGSLSGCVPELPMNIFYRSCGHQQFAANLKQVNFANGSGVRFVTVHGIHDLAPVDNEHLVYVFQGFSDDGNYYVKMYVRLLHSQLPDVGEVPQELQFGDQEIVGEYFAGITDMLNSSEDGYSPKLDWIDAFLASLHVEQLD